MEIRKTIGKNLQLARKVAKLSQVVLAQEMGKKQQEYCKYERGIIELDYEKIVFLCHRLDITPNELFGWD